MYAAGAAILFINNLFGVCIEIAFRFAAVAFTCLAPHQPHREL